MTSGILFRTYFRLNKKGFRLMRGHAGEKLLEAVADE
jgi:hypothetical protein